MVHTSCERDSVRARNASAKRGGWRDDRFLFSFRRNAAEKRVCDLARHGNLVSESDQRPYGRIRFDQTEGNDSHGREDHIARQDAGYRRVHATRYSLRRNLTGYWWLATARCSRCIFTSLWRL